MPNYYNPYNFYPVTYANQMGYSAMPMQQQINQTPQQSYAAPVQQGPKMMEWVEGEVGAKAFQMPNGWPANSPIPLWDSTDTVIYLKSWGPMGIPNPLQKLRYEMPEQQNQAMLMSGDGGNSRNGGNGQGDHQDMSQYVTKQDFEQLRNEIRNMNQSGAGNSGQSNQNGSNSGQNGGNRGGNR